MRAGLPCTIVAAAIARVCTHEKFRATRSPSPVRLHRMRCLRFRLPQSYSVGGDTARRQTRTGDHRLRTAPGVAGEAAISRTPDAYRTCTARARGAART